MISATYISEPHMNPEKITTCAAELVVDVLRLFETVVVEMIVKPVHDNGYLA